ncbi:MAG: (d)CMP kinase [gamma proteobacterium symbiont of Bathyaustriella thionipta]|nr:(d)CMP kinase [gamma proteobacterium symbiont of Bathyaustriella thionipta]MCU7949234.1 (d)CMP kinase [gamma proteobacterium symbiont of Bathyaustriella thionipta]MCU7954806.1 (d)CMP kinase [gamma proteobacterium symbiont of Bathyaustriella thionipta]MCU7955824.1 (d)CMP kinase [gamma proteobacterium symbiont of Bathyaustriella thionipta]MCU7967253.1 (d)CMP kinase [gamma proteobacterium symbiont of Bathyaustriella thionipta]
MSDLTPVITLDGPGGVGKGTISALLAEKLGWHYLDSGALYRLTALACMKKGVALEAENEVAEIAEYLAVKFLPQGGVLLEEQDVEALIRTESAGNNASIVAALPMVREALFKRQKAFLQMPGLIADGRDMGTTIFPDAPLKVFLTATADERAKRRYKQLIEKGNSVKITDLVNEIRERDERDMNRSASPLKAAQDAYIIDTSELSINEVFEKVMQLYKNLNQ